MALNLFKKFIKFLCYDLAERTIPEEATIMEFTMDETTIAWNLTLPGVCFP